MTWCSSTTFGNKWQKKQRERSLLAGRTTGVSRRGGKAMSTNFDLFRSDGGMCAFCTWQKVRYAIPHLGSYCSMECLETVLCGLGRCRWCGKRMENPYTSVDSRLCSEDCSANYYAYVLGDRTAALGSGKRFLAWLQQHQPAIYAKVAGLRESGGQSLGRPTINAHAMTGAERVREHRAKRLFV